MEINDRLDKIIAGFKKDIHEYQERYGVESEWIPCSERLPGNKTYVLTSIHVPGRQPHVRSGWYQDGLFRNDNGDVWRNTDFEVKAWMPSPDPYEEKDDDRP